MQSYKNYCYLCTPKQSNFNMKRKKFYIVALSVVLLSVSCTKLPETVKDSLGKSMSETASKLEDMGFKFDRQAAVQVIYEHGDTLVTLIPSMGDNEKVAGIYMTINSFDPEVALKRYKELRDYCKDTYPYYGAKIIYNEPYNVFSSTDPMTIDTISAEFLGNNDISINERWHAEDDMNNRNSIAIKRLNHLYIWQVNLMFRNNEAFDF